MLEQKGGGSIVVISSLQGKFGVPQRSSCEYGYGCLQSSRKHLAFTSEALEIVLDIKGISRSLLQLVICN